MFHIDNAQFDSAQVTFDDGYDRAEIRRHGFATPDRKGGVFFHNPDDLSPEHCTTDEEWQQTLDLINAAPDLKQALRDLMDDYASHLGVPSEACDKGVFKQAWAAIYKAEGAA